MVITTLVVVYGMHRYMTLDMTFIDVRNGRYVCQTFNGRLGNHIFQFASIYGIARKNNLTILLSENDDLVKYFKVPSAKRLTKRRVCDRFVLKLAKHCCKFDETVMNLRNDTNYLLGEYLQSWKYFGSVFKEVRQELSFDDVIENKSKSLVETLRESHMQRLSVSSLVVVGIHIRRGDLATFIGNGVGVEPASDEYIRHAVDYMLQLHKHVLFVVCSDDMDYAKNVTNYRNINVEFVHLDPIDDLAILAHTDHVIMTVGTFGWWAGFLSRGTVIYYKYPIREGTIARSEYNYDEFFPHDWVGLS